MKPVRSLLVILLSALVTLLGLTVAPDAQAAGSRMGTTGGWYECTRTSMSGCVSRGTIAAGTTVTMHCWIDDSTATGTYSSPRWFYVTASNGIRGFVHSSRVVSQTTTPHCSTHRGISAGRWAAMHVGAVTPTTAERNGNPATMWSGWCYLFAYDAHALSHGTRPYSGYGTARATYDAYYRAGRVSTDLRAQSISIGSIVFWRNLSSWGHAAIYVGNGYVITTQGDGSRALPVARVPMTSLGTPSGWVSPTKI